MGIARLLFFLVLFFCLGFLPAFTQAPVPAPRLEHPPTIDGRIEEAPWQAAAVFTDFKTIQPDFGKPPTELTELRVGHDDDFVYVGFICHDSAAEKIKANLNRRDDPAGDDWVAFCLDTYNDESTAYSTDCLSLSARHLAGADEFRRPGHRPSGQRLALGVALSSGERIFGHLSGLSQFAITALVLPALSDLAEKPLGAPAPASRRDGGLRPAPHLLHVCSPLLVVSAFRPGELSGVLRPAEVSHYHGVLQAVYCLFQQALQRARRQIAMAINYEDVFQRLLQEVHKDRSFQQRLLVNVGSRYFFLPVEQILYITAEDKYLNLHTADKRYLLRETLSNLETKLDPARFVRIHRSHLVNVDYIKELHPRAHGDYDLVLKNGVQLVVSRRYRDRLFGG